MELGVFWIVLPRFWAPFSQSHPDKPPDRHRRNDVFLISEGSQGLEFFVGKPDRKFSSFHGFVFRSEHTLAGK